MPKSKFKPLKQGCTMGDAYNPAMHIKTKKDADAYFKILMEYAANHWRPKVNAEKAERILKTTLGYWAGYFDGATRARVERLFQCEHPIFGAIAKKGAPTAKEAFEAGKKMGEKVARKGKK